MNHRMPNKFIYEFKKFGMPCYQHSSNDIYKLLMGIVHFLKPKEEAI